MIDLDKVLAGQFGPSNDVVLRNGDQLRIPKIPQELMVIAEV